jgi:hypothetical protein
MLNNHLCNAFFATVNVAGAAAMHALAFSFCDALEYDIK